MEQRSVHVNCIKIQFEVVSKMPLDSEIFAFLRKCAWAPETLVAMFRAPREHCVYVKFQTSDQMKAALRKCRSKDIFNYENGETTQVYFSTANGNFRYIRLFGLPVEVEDKHVVDMLAKYGKIHHLTRERYAPDTGFPILNGVRGAHMEVAKEIPAQLFIQHFQIRVSYEGMPTKCYVCQSTEHVKAACPKRRKAEGSETLSYAETLKNKNDTAPPEPKKQASGTEQLSPEKQQLARTRASDTPKDQERNIQAFEELAFGASGEIDLPPKKPDEDEYVVDLEDPEWFTAKKRNRAERQAAGSGSDSSNPDDSKVLRPSLSLLEKQAIRTRAQAKVRGKK